MEFLPGARDCCLRQFALYLILKMSLQDYYFISLIIERNDSPWGFITWARTQILRQSWNSKIKCIFTSIPVSHAVSKKVIISLLFPSLWLLCGWVHILDHMIFHRFLSLSSFSIFTYYLSFVPHFPPFFIINAFFPTSLKVFTVTLDIYIYPKDWRIKLKDKIIQLCELIVTS